MQQAAHPDDEQLINIQTAEALMISHSHVTAVDRDCATMAVGGLATATAPLLPILSPRVSIAQTLSLLH